MSQLLLTLGLILAFLSVVVLVQTSAGLLFALRDRKARVNRRLAMFDAGLDRRQVYSRLVRTRPTAPQSAVIRRIELSLRRMLQRAGVTTPLPRLILIVGAAAGGLWLVSLSFWTHGGGAKIALNAVVSLIACTAIVIIAAGVWLQRRRRKRLAQIEAQMPIALDVMSRALRAGHPVISSIQLAADEMGDPLGSEFGLALDETTYGAELQEALANLAERTGSPDADFLAVSVCVQIETGGNLSEILEGLAAVIRSRSNLKQKVKAVSSEGRASALILSALPALLVAVQLSVQPEVYTDKFSDPIFWPAVGGTAGLYVAGWLIIQRIINFKY